MEEELSTTRLIFISLNVFVNIVQVLKDGEHTAETPGRFIKGSGWVPVNK